MAEFRTGRETGDTHPLGSGRGSSAPTRHDSFRQDHAVSAPAPTSAASARRRMLLDQANMRPAAVDHRLGRADAAPAVRTDAAVIADYNAAAEARRAEYRRMAAADADRRAATGADAQRRLDAAITAINRPAPPPAGYAPPRPYQASAATAARARCQVHAEMGVTRHEEQVRMDEQAEPSASAGEARRRLHNMGA